MNVTTIILGIISIVLAVAFFFSLGSLKSNNSSADQNEIEEIREQIAALNAEAAALRHAPNPYSTAQIPASSPSSAVVPPAMPDTTATTEISPEDLAEIERLKAEVASMKEGKEKAERKADVANEEALMALGEKTKANDRLERNKRAVANALTLGKVVAYNSELGFLTFRPAMDRVFNPGEKLAVRRNTGILSRITVSGEGNGEVAADVMPNVLAGGMPGIKPGDDIILLPDYYDPPEDLTSGSGNGENENNSGIPSLPDLPHFEAPPTPDAVQEIPLE